MDYTKGAVDLNRRSLVSVIKKRLGPQVSAPTGAYFGTAHLVEMLADIRFYALSAGREGKGDRAVAYLEEYIKFRIWVKRVRDCENRAHKALGDLSDAAVKLAWKANAAVMVICYVSKSLKRGRTGYWDGYHAALLVVKWSPSKRNFEVWIVEPKTEWEDGSVAPEMWRTPEEEVEKWVYFQGR